MPVKRKPKWKDTRDAMTRVAQDAVREAGVMMQAALRASAGDGPNIVSGRLRRSIKTDRSGLRSKTHPRVRVGPRIWYAPVHEYGGILKASKGYLTIPLTQEAKRIAKKGSFKQHKLITVTSKAGNLLMGKKTDKRKEFRPMFLLRKQVRIPARPFVRPTARRERPAIIKMIRTRITLAAQFIKNTPAVVQ